MDIYINNFIRNNMHKYLLTKLGILSSALVLVVATSATVYALSAQTNINAKAQTSLGTNTTSSTTSMSTKSNANSSNSSHLSSQSNNASTTGKTKSAMAKLKACQNRQTAIINIMNRIDSRAQKQINLFSTIATRVEAFYTKQGKTLSDYSQLVLAVNTTQAQATSEFATVKTNSTFNCNVAHPHAMVVAFRGYLGTEITDLKDFKTAVKNLIVGVASVNGVNVSTSTQSTTQGSK